jgi:hypothetical protein
MTKATQYIIGERWKDSHGQGTMYLGYHDADFAFWAWAKGKAEATRYSSKDEAVKAADTWRAAIVRSGYKPGKTKVMPVAARGSGGPDCEYRPADLR